MSSPFFDHPILNSHYACPARHWELDGSGQTKVAAQFEAMLGKVAT